MLNWAPLSPSQLLQKPKQPVLLRISNKTTWQTFSLWAGKVAGVCRAYCNVTDLNLSPFYSFELLRLIFDDCQFQLTLLVMFGKRIFWALLGRFFSMNVLYMFRFFENCLSGNYNDVIGKYYIEEFVYNIKYLLSLALGINCKWYNEATGNGVHSTFFILQN